jgi:hypothetical protein
MMLVPILTNQKTNLKEIGWFILQDWIACSVFGALCLFLKELILVKLTRPRSAEQLEKGIRKD